jgi:hypothetical protein
MDIDDEWMMFINLQNNASSSQNNMNYSTQACKNSKNKNVCKENKTSPSEKLDIKMANIPISLKLTKEDDISIVKKNVQTVEAPVEQDIPEMVNKSVETTVEQPTDTIVRQITNQPDEQCEKIQKICNLFNKLNPTIKPFDLLISTKTKVLFLNQMVDIHNIFWKIPIIDYWRPEQGVVKKQIKIVSKTKEQLDEYKQKLNSLMYYQEHILKQIDNPTSRSIQFKDERKLTVGISKKDITMQKNRIKNAFYNCMAIVIRFRPIVNGIQTQFKEVHVKLFNTGKMEIPGIVNYLILEQVKQIVLNILSEFRVIANTSCDISSESATEKILFVDNCKEDHVLINSNFNCGFFVNREKLYLILNSPKYNLETSYDPCNYPGVKCRFYFNIEIGFNIQQQTGSVLETDRNYKLSDLTECKKYTEVSIMIFRTGSCIIVGNCSEKILRFIFNFIKKILLDEYENICSNKEIPIIKVKPIKNIKKTIYIS